MFELQHWLYSGVSSQLKTLSGEFSLPSLTTGMFIAALFGFVHALMPGHGKIALVSYFFGRPAKVVSGLAASAILLLAHVGSAVVLVLAGFIVLQKTIGGAGRAPALETASALLIVSIGAWLLYNAARHRHPEKASADGRMLAFAAGLVPCPLTTFIMVYSVTNEIVAAGLLLTAGMAVGMLVTIATFAIATVLLRERMLEFMASTAIARGRITRILEQTSAAAIILFGIWLLAAR